MSNDLDEASEKLRGLHGQSNRTLHDVLSTVVAHLRTSIPPAPPPASTTEKGSVCPCTVRGTATPDPDCNRCDGSGFRRNGAGDPPPHAMTSAPSDEELTLEELARLRDEVRKVESGDNVEIAFGPMLKVIAMAERSLTSGSYDAGKAAGVAEREAMRRVVEAAVRWHGASAVFEQPGGDYEHGVEMGAAEAGLCDAVDALPPDLRRDGEGR